MMRGTFNASRDVRASIDDTPLILRLTVDALIELQDAAGLDDLQEYCTLMQDRLARSDLKVLRQLLVAQMRYHHPDAEELVAGMTMDDITALAQPIAEAMMLAMPKAAAAGPLPKAAEPASS